MQTIEDIQAWIDTEFAQPSDDLRGLFARLRDLAENEISAQGRFAHEINSALSIYLAEKMS